MPAKAGTHHFLCRTQRSRRWYAFAHHDGYRAQRVNLSAIWYQPFRRLLWQRGRPQPNRIGGDKAVSFPASLSEPQWIGSVRNIRVHLRRTFSTRATPSLQNIPKRFVLRATEKRSFCRRCTQINTARPEAATKRYGVPHCCC
jgi:hypothetical protein